MQPRNPDFRTLVQRIFNTAPFVRDVGVELADIGPGWCETVLTLRPEHYQQDDVVHAGVQATLADHTAGAAANSLVDANEIILTAEFKISFLRPARGEILRCRSEVIKAGRHLTTAESDVLAVTADESTLVAKALVTLAVVPRPAGRPGNG